MHILFWIALFLLHAIGCGRMPAVIGGTEGVVRAGDVAIDGVEVKIYDQATATLLGLGTSGPDGTFNLVTPAAAGPLNLTSGEYVATLEAVGPDVPKLPAGSLDFRTSMLKISRASDSEPIEIKLPAIK